MAPSDSVVGLGGLEPPASPLSGVRSNHLSYRPGNLSSSGEKRSTFRSSKATKRDGRCPRHECRVKMQVSCVDVLRGRRMSFSKGGDPAAPSDTATLLRLHPSHEPLRGRRPPCG